MTRLAVAVVILIASTGLSVPSDRRVSSQDHLTVGYEGEGKVDNSFEACMAVASGMGIEAAHKVCDARNRHIVAYQRFQTAYARLGKILSADRRINLVAAMDQLKQLIRSCISHKLYITTGGHNIMMDIIPNEAAANCVSLGADLLTSEADNIEVATKATKLKSNSQSIAGLPPESSSQEKTAPITFFGNWYVQNISACKNKPGQSEELVTYTQDRTIGPEMSCKILRATPQGFATELDLLCNGEGERGIRQKEVVQVVNGRLQVSYLANGRKMTDIYLRCP